MPTNQPILEVRDLHVAFGHGNKRFEAVRGVSFDVMRGETFGIVGESGSGKTTIGRTVIRVNPATSGSIRYEGEEITGRISRELDRKIISKIQMIFQDPMASLNERAKISYIVSEGLQGRGLPKAEIEQKVTAALNEVGLLPEFASRFPHEFSGGQRQRIGIARALVMQPEFIIADEPISALDVSIRAQVLNLLAKLQKSRGLTYLFISHDLSVMRFICDRIAVIHLGKIVELCETEELFRHPLHPYTQALLSAVPVPSPRYARQAKPLTYDPAIHDYSADPPQWREVAPGHYALGNQREQAQYEQLLSREANV